MKINSREMSDLEIILVALNRTYGFESEERTNILSEIVNGQFMCEQRILRMLQDVLRTKIEEKTITSQVG